MGKVSCNCCTPKATDPSNLHRLAEAKLGQVANNPGICLNNLSIQSQSIFCSRDLGAWKCRILELENADPTSMKTPGSFFCLKSTWPKKDVPRWWVYELITSRCFITSSSKTPHSGHCFFLGGELHDAFPRDETVCLLLGASQIHCNVFEILHQKLYIWVIKWKYTSWKRYSTNSSTKMKGWLREKWDIFVYIYIYIYKYVY